MNLVIDIGNTFVKLAVFKTDTIVCRVHCRLDEFQNTYTKLTRKFTEITHAIIAAVGELPQPYVSRIQKDFEVLILDSETPVPFKNLYDTPKTLGVDRIALVSAAVKHVPNTDALIIDTGSCITYDFKNKNNHYLGGAISPGLHMRYQSLHHFTAKLPLLETKVPEGIIGNTTALAIHAGVVKGIVYEIDGVIDNYRSKFPDLTVILTGGDTIFLSNQLKNSIFANSDFLLEGLNLILEFNS